MADENSKEVGADKVRVLKDGTWRGITGKKVIIGLIDSGIQYKSQSFRNKDGSSRILFIYDQTQTNTNLPHDDGATEPHTAVSFVLGDPLWVGIGAEYKQDVITSAVRSGSSLKHVDEVGHGTITAGIAASNGFQLDKCSRLYSGIAPEADIIAVKVKQGASQNDVLDAICYLILKAKDLTRPLVINLSISFNIDGYHNGNSRLEKNIDHFLKNPPNGRALSIVTIAGNFRDKSMHVKGSVGINDKIKTYFVLRRNEVNKIFQVWCDIKDKHPVKFKLVSPKGEATAELTSPNTQVSVSVGKRGHIDVVSEIVEEPTGEKYQVITVGVLLPIAKGLLAGQNNSDYFLGPQVDFTNQYYIELINPTENTAAVDFHMWANTDDLRFQGDPKVDENATVTIPGTAKGIITVGAHQFKGGILSLSGKGTTVQNVIKPEITAPGKNVVSVDNDLPGWCTRKCCCCCDIYHTTDNPGTSLSAPFVAGAIALILDLKPNLTNDEIRDLLFRNIKTDASTPPPANLPNTLWGYGKLDVKKLVEEVNNSLPTPRPLNMSAINSPVLAPAIEMVEGEASLSAARLMELEEEFMSSAGGQFFYSLAQKHSEELLNLINYNKKVATVWHRNDGPLLLRLFARFLIKPEKKMPSVVNARPVKERLINVAAILERFASETLALDIGKQLPLLLQLEGKSVNQIMHLLKSRKDW